MIFYNRCVAKFMPIHRMGLGVFWMFNICMQCEAYRSDKTIDLSGPYAICPICGCKHEFLRLPLFVITGASGSGKSRMAIELAKIITDVVVIECDIFWRAEFHEDSGNFWEFREFCLRAAKNICQGGRPVVLCGAASPPQYENCTEFRYFSGIHYLILYCDKEELRQRLKQRPEYRRCHSDDFIKKQQSYNKYLYQLGNTSENMKVLDTGGLSCTEMAVKAREWVHDILSRGDRKSFMIRDNE